MERVYNFGAGPAMLPEEVLKQAQEEMLSWKGYKVSAMEIGHRGPEFRYIAEQSEADLRQLMAIPDHYQVVFLAGGASVHFAMVPLNLFATHAKADYVDTGVWSKKAIIEAARYGDVKTVATTHFDSELIQIPDQQSWQLRPDAAYVHYTPNETINGLEFNWVPETGDVPLVADMTSMILSRPTDVSQYGIIYAGAQKNLGQAGISVAIIRDDLLKDPLPFTPTLYNYKVQAANHSFYNTPPTYSWYILSLVLEWMKRQGGLSYFTDLNIRKATKLYQCIDSHADFYVNTVNPNSRSRMNVVFDLKNSDLTPLFLDLANKEGLVYLKGHQLVGGMRASIYNAMPEAAIDKLVKFMQEFAKRFG
jgi:phosphoserine aminotransferase